MLTENNLKHMLGVARRCEELAREKGCSAPRAYFKLGLLHEIGREWGNEQTYAAIGREVTGINEIGMQMKARILRSSLRTKTLDILNQALLETSEDGQHCTVTEKLEELEKQFSRGSRQYQFARIIAAELDLK